MNFLLTGYLPSFSSLLALGMYRVVETEFHLHCVTFLTNTAIKLKSPVRRFSASAFVDFVYFVD